PYTPLSRSRPGPPRGRSPSILYLPDGRCGSSLKGKKACPLVHPTRGTFVFRSTAARLRRGEPRLHWRGGASATRLTAGRSGSGGCRGKETGLLRLEKESRFGATVR